MIAKQSPAPSHDSPTSAKPSLSTLPPTSAMSRNTPAVGSQEDPGVPAQPLQPSRLGRIVRKFRTLFRRAYHFVLLKFIHLIALLSDAGQWPTGILQGWALRRMGVRCPSNDVYIGQHTAIDNPKRLILGHRVVIGPDSRLTGYKADIVIGDDFLSAPGLYINTGTHDLETLVPEYAPVTIEPGVWCGTRVTICAGVTIGADAVIGAGAVVVRNIPAGQLAVGVPARPVRVARREPTTKRWSNFSHH